MSKHLVVFGASNILSDLFDCAWSLGVAPGKVVLHEHPPSDPRSVPLAERLARLAPLGPVPSIQALGDFRPAEGEVYILGPTTPRRAHLAEALKSRFALEFHSLVHSSATVSPLATISPGCFVGAGSVIAPGVLLAEHVFVNRCASIGHDTQVGAFSRIQPGAHVASLSSVGRGVTIGIGARLVDRLVIGDNAEIGAGSVVLRDVPNDAVVWGSPARVQRAVLHPVFRERAAECG